MHLFFDLDGTLTDPQIGITKSVAYALTKIGLPVPALDELTWVIGPALIDSFTQLGAENPEEALRHYRERYVDVGLFENSVYSGIPDVLQHLIDEGFEASVATAKPHVYARRITAHFGLSQFMTHEFGPELDGTRNNKGDLLGHALELTGIRASEAVMIGDRIHDFDAARAVGMACIGVTWGFGSDEEIARADVACQSPRALPDAIREIFSV